MTPAVVEKRAMPIRRCHPGSTVPRARLAELGFDLAAVRSALEPPTARVEGDADIAFDTEDLEARMRRTLEAAPLSTPVRRAPKRPGTPATLFLIEGFVNPEQSEPDEDHVETPGTDDKPAEHQGVSPEPEEPDNH